MDSAELTVGQLSARSGVSISALRFYEREGLISSRRTAGNQRRYHRGTLRVVALIRIAQRVGIPLSEISDTIRTLPACAVATRQDWVRMSSAWRTRLDQRIKELHQLRDEFSDCIGCGCLSLDRCKLANPSDRLAALGSGPHKLQDPRACAELCQE